MFKDDQSKIVSNERPVFNQMILSTEPFDVSQSGSPLSPLEAFARGKPRLARSPRKAARKPKSRALRRRVLVVDDIPDVTEMIGLFLKHVGYEVITAESAAAALQVALEQNFDLIISDIGMPEMTGYELATALRSLKDYASVPIIAVTGYSEYDDRGRAQRAGFNAHLTKPIDPSQLLHLMDELLTSPEPNPK